MPQKKTRFDIDEALRLVRRQIRKFKVPAVSKVAEDRDPFKILISCLISLRTKDEVTGEASRRLFAVADSPEAIAGLPRA